jgi:hypothetical protein
MVRSMAFAVIFGLMAAPATTAPRKPRLSVRAFPAMALPPATVLVSADLQGDEHEDLHCPEVEWNWADGSRSVRQSDCEPHQAGEPVERHFSHRHDYHHPGQYWVTVTLRRGDRVISQGGATVFVYVASVD